VGSIENVGKTIMHETFCFVNLKVRDYLKDPSVDGRIQLDLKANKV
jgi:hypothetical protein